MSSGFFIIISQDSLTQRTPSSMVDLVTLACYLSLLFHPSLFLYKTSKL